MQPCTDTADCCQVPRMPPDPRWGRGHATTALITWNVKQIKQNLVNL